MLANLPDDKDRLKLYMRSQKGFSAEGLCASPEQNAQPELVQQRVRGVFKPVAAQDIPRDLAFRQSDCPFRGAWYRCKSDQATPEGVLAVD